MEKKKSIEEILRELEEMQLLDDHYPAIIGERKHKPSINK